MLFPLFFFGGSKRTDATAGRKEGVTTSMTIAWDDQFKRANIMWKVPRNIRMNDNIVVREDEIAVFYRDGKALAYFDRPDRYALTSQNAAVWGRIMHIFTGIVQQAEVYYLQKRMFDGKFGSKEPFLFQDPDFDMIQLRAFGEFRYRVQDPEVFINQFVGTFGAATSAEVEDRIKDELMKQLNVTLGKMKANGLRVVDLAASLNDIEQTVLANAKPHFANLGVEIVKMSDLNIPLPEQVKDAIEKMASAKVLGRTSAAAYQQFAVADAIKTAAAQPGGSAGAGLGLGAGIGMGYSMGSQMPQMMAPGAQGGQQVKPCPKCGENNAVDQKFCGKCGADTSVTGKPCVKCGKPVPPGKKFCGECGAAQTVTCPDGHEVPGNMKFCPECGKPVEG